jgi:CubicO group peptidase (beta-lactamase class C family)
MSSEHLVTPLGDELDALFGQYTAANQSRGLVYGLVGPNGLVHSAGFGVADDAGTVPDPDTVFPIASMSKSFAACAALLARDRGLLNLDAPITDFFDEFSATGTFDDPCDPPTIRMLLSMGGGLTEDNSWVDPFIDMPEQQLLATIGKGLYYSNLPGTVFEYSNLGFTLAGLAVGRAVGARIEDFVRDELLMPLGMTSTWFDNSAPDGGPARATGYSLDPAGNWVGYPPAQSGAFAAAGGMQSTVRDLATWVTFLGSAFRPPAGAGSGADSAPVRRASRREMQRVHQVNLPAVASRADGSWRFGFGGYGLGLGISEDLNLGTIIGHSGGLPGFLLNMTWHPDSGHGIVVLTNSHRGNPIALAQEALFRALDHHSAPARTVRLWPATRDLQQQADALIRSWDDQLAGRILADNIDFDRRLTERRAEIEKFIAEIGPLTERRPMPDVLSAATPADVTWSIPGQRGELLCMIHLTPVQPAQIQELEVRVARYDTPRSARPDDISPRRAGLGASFLSSLPNTRVVWPDDPAR